MSEGGFNIVEDKAVKLNKHVNLILVLYRWIFFVFVVVLALFGMNLKRDGYAIFELIALAVIYNCLISIYIINNKNKSGKSFKNTHYFDVVFLMIFPLFSGGINSEVYVLTFFLLAFCAKFNDVTFTIKIGVLSAILYSASCIFEAKLNTGDINYFRLIIKDILFVFGAYGISRISYEVQKFDNLRKKEFRIARTDKLTGLANRHYFDQRLVKEAEFVDETKSVLNVMMFDLDNFKGFNDTYGHVAGDELLKLFAEIIKQNMRKTDIPVRYGGEEFLILLRDLDLAITKSICDRIRTQLEKQHLHLGEEYNNRSVTVSCGIAQYPTHSDNIKKVIELADKALYYAKENGKNVVVTYDEIL